MKYDFAFSWDSTYGYAARLAGENADPGLVIDLGAGLGTFAQPLTELGFQYLGFEYDAESVEECRRRGLECEQIDLRDVDGLIDRVRQAVGDRHVVAVSMLDVVEHLPEPDVVLAGLAALLDAIAVGERPPLLVLSIPNVSHVDLAAKLVFGRWDVTEVGLLDSTHITLFTHDRLVRAVEAAGLVEVGRNDVVFPDTEQRFPIDHPAVAQDTPLSLLLRSLRLRADPFGHTYQFVRCYRRGVAPVIADVDGTRCTVVVTASGEGSLSETLASLGSQTDLDIDVRIVAPARCVDRVGEQVDALESSFDERVHVHPVDSERRADLLNAGLERATGRLVMFLAGGDVVDRTAIERLCACADAHPGQLLRFTAAEVPFDLLRHLIVDETPLEAIAIPAMALHALRLRFVDVGDDLEGWDFICRAASALGVVDCGIDAPSGAVAAADDRLVPPELPAPIDRDHLVLPPGAAPIVRRALLALRERHDLESRLEIAQQRIDALERSRYWRLTAPVRRLTSKRPSLRFWRPRGVRPD